MVVRNLYKTKHLHVLTAYTDVFNRAGVVFKYLTSELR